MLIIFAIIIMIIGIFFVCTKKDPYIDIGRVFILIPASLGTVVAALLFIIFAPSRLHIIVYIALAAVIITFFAALLYGGIKYKKVYIPLICVTLACAISLGGYYLHIIYVDSIPTIRESEGILYDYIPYSSGTKVAELDEPSTLTIDSDIPKLDGATALYPIYSAFAKAVYPEEFISEPRVYAEYLTCNTTTGAYETIVTGESDIIFVAAPSEEQKQFAAENGVEFVFTPIGKEAFVFFVNSQNPIEDISLSQIQDIYSGEITKWSELGVEDLGNIRAFQRDKGSGSQSALERIMNGKELITPPMEDIVSGMGGIISRAADYKNYKNAIGFSFRFYSTEMVKNDHIKLLSINGIAPTAENIQNGTYPIASYFYAVTRSDASENTKKLVEWIRSQQGQELIEKTGYTPLSEDDLDSEVIFPELPAEKEEPLNEAELEEINALRRDYDYGTCRNLSGNITVVLLFMNDFESEWSDESALKFMEYEALPALAFMEEQAARYGIDLSFTVEAYSDLYYDDEVIISSKETGYVTVDTLYQAAKRLGYDSDYDFHEYIQNEYGNDEVIYLTIFNKNGTGYALNPRPDTDYDMVEHSIIFAYDLNSDRTDPLGSQASIISMEILYLYGAENLKSPNTRKSLAQFLYPGDVMLYAQYDIADNEISDVTAFYVGWTNEIPQAFSFDGWNDEAN